MDPSTEKESTQRIRRRSSSALEVTSTPILRLHEDILWRICSVLAHPLPDYHYPGLISLRHLSQVCVSWRKLVLASSSLWGRVIDGRYLSQKTDDWRDEVLSRTGQSLLYVQDDHNRANSTTGAGHEKFLMMLLTRHWARIRKLDIGFGWPAISRDLKTAISRAFQMPAPHLEYFGVHFYSTTPSRFLSRKFNLFADHAPFLRHFLAFGFRIPPQASWLSKTIRKLRLTGIKSFTASELLIALSRMPLLKWLEIIADPSEADSPTAGEIQGSMKKAILPCLIHLNVEAGNAVRKYLTILDHIETEPGFYFRFQTNPVALHPSDTSTGQRVLHTYFPLSLDDETPEKLRLVMDHRFILIDSSSHFEFIFAMEFLHDIPDPSIFLNSISSVSFDDVTSFELLFSEDNVSLASANVLPIISSLTSVEELNVNLASLCFILSLPPTLIDGTVSFPCLQELDIDHCNLKQDSAIIIDFLSKRAKLDAPISVLKLGHSFHCQEVDDRDLEKLERFDGLKLIWTEGLSNDSEARSREYICGGRSCP